MISIFGGNYYNKQIHSNFMIINLLTFIFDAGQGGRGKGIWGKLERNLKLRVFSGCDAK